MITEFYGVIHDLEEAQKMSLLLGLMLCWCFVIDEILVLITVGKLGLGLFIFFVKGMYVLISWLI